MSPSAARFDGLICSVCGYDLRGLPENVCPECGVEFDPSRIKRPVRWQPSRHAGTQAAIAAIPVSASLIIMYLLMALESIDVPPMGTCGTYLASRTAILFCSGFLLAVPCCLWITSLWAGGGERLARNALLAATTAWLTCHFMVSNQHAF